MGIRKIAIVGSGQLGSRHLQSLAKLQQKAYLFLVDPSESALNIAKDRFNEVVIDKNSIPEITFLTQVSQLPPEIDLAIIACNSFQRRQVLEQLFKSTKCSYMILEKFLFPSVEDYDVVNGLIKKNNTTAWVNCSRRMYTDYQKLKEFLKSESEINMQVSAGQLGLGSNAIHHIDLFKFLGATALVNIQTNGLKRKILPSKRNGYIEFFGTLIVNAENGVLSITSFENSNLPVSISITTPNKKIFIQESSTPFMLSYEKEDNWQQTNHTFTIQHQSELTHLAVDQIFTNANCSLPMYEESSTLHTALLYSYLEFYNSVTGKSIKSCPIT